MSLSLSFSLSVSLRHLLSWTCGWASLSFTWMYVGFKMLLRGSISSLGLESMLWFSDTFLSMCACLLCVCVCACKLTPCANVIQVTPPYPTWIITDFTLSMKSASVMMQRSIGVHCAPPFCPKQPLVKVCVHCVCAWCSLSQSSVGGFRRQPDNSLYSTHNP